MHRPHAVEAQNYGRDGAMRFDGNAGASKNYESDSSADSDYGDRVARAVEALRAR